MEAIKTTNLTKYYGKNRGIIDLNLCVEEKEFFGFIGPNGAGKSTTIRTLLGLITQSSGEARIFDQDTRKEKTWILEQVGYLPSETAFYPGMRVRDILKLSADLRKKDCGEEAKRITVHGRIRLEGLHGIHDLQSAENGASFLYTGDINELIRILSENHITDLTVAEPDLEEIFMHYYTDGGKTE